MEERPAKTRQHASPRLLEALAFAVEKHGAVRQPRKGTTFPYVIHPLRVAEILFLHGCDEDVVVAGLLHDTTEDAGVARDELESRFGRRVAELVAGASEPDKTLPWRVRKERAIEHVRTTRDRDVLNVIAADKLDNLRSLRTTLAEEGADATWRRFNAGEAEQRSYLRTIAEALLERDPASRLFRSVQLEVDEVFPPAG